MLYRAVVVVGSDRQPQDDRYFATYDWAYDHGWRMSAFLKTRHRVEVEAGEASWVAVPDRFWILPEQVEQDPVWWPVESNRAWTQASVVRAGQRIEAIMDYPDGSTQSHLGTAERVERMPDGWWRIVTDKYFLTDAPNVTWYLVEDEVWF
ncbi:hypothetical protein [Georgenia yuyongxinii]|uniref:Uncharacterized protein n=1 Tax=Georgenia yuyongxinii TaxID=2589797 RepID=A0A552WNM8_9MICO|nr:hypothetical protein [Georgenia yuyongxinii]TRW44388.1 hypothetical protein FJ693_13745 [Georgenia yuyongxinii]